MRGIRVLALTVVAALATTLSLGSSVGARQSKARHGQHDVAKANLRGAEEVPGPGDTDGRGKALAKVLPRFGAVCFKLRWRDIADPTAAHIHRGARGAAGPIVVTLFSGAARDRGCVDGVNVDLLREIREHPRRFYVNTHNAAFPDGAIRGQLKHTGHHRGARLGGEGKRA